MDRDIKKKKNKQKWRIQTVKTPAELDQNTRQIKFHERKSAIAYCPWTL